MAEKTTALSTKGDEDFSKLRLPIDENQHSVCQPEQLTDIPPLFSFSS
jgi:hypothetical protein